jgi:hypothetical protein
VLHLFFGNLYFSGGALVVCSDNDFVFDYVGEELVEKLYLVGGELDNDGI